MPYCPNCGKEISEDDEFCSKCRQPLKGQPIRRVRRRDEKDEKNERDEKDEKHEDQQSGAIVGGLIVVWLGVSFMLQNTGVLYWADFGGIFLLGLGLILVFRGLWAYSQTGVFDAGFGYIVGGGFVALLGAGISFDLEEWWPVFLIGIGLVVVFRALTAKSKNPVP
ncbi:zinc-ribbon domain-containing protein [Candidatus Bathyarchaeota archaeon]|nr:zinc-ribbon domain-containing protein [Candidatus Bathyarchaeota archaeon]